MTAILATLCALSRQGLADTVPRHLVVALPAGPSPRTVGFYLAQQEGYFGDRDLTVDFITSATETPSRLLADGKADLAVDLMPVALRLHQDGTAIQHVAQFFQHSSLGLYCRPPIAKPDDLHGTTIGVWFGGEESSFYAWMSSLNISTFGEEDGVTVLRQGRVAKALADARLDCVTSTSYLVPLQMQASGIAPGSRTVFRYEALNVGTLEDGLYARTRDLRDKGRVDIFSRFLAASIRGWQKLHDDRPAALRLLLSRPDLATDQADQALDATALDDSAMPGAEAKTTPAAAATVAIATSKTHGKDNAHAKPLTRPVAIADTGGADAATPANKAATASSAVADQNGKSSHAVDPAALKASLDAVDALIDPGHARIGSLDTDSYDRTVNLLLTGAPEPILKSAPEDAISDVLLQHLRQGDGQPKP